ncbi:terminase family protein [Gordonia sp. CPCC 205515]|uniref:terminase large subunit domain-containing protein n=1 Tax=Gordonia sp. CPCC 205515 TaxID=3140791 RepID=UPI003AF3D1E5
MPTTTAPSFDEIIARSKGDVGFFAEHVLKTPLLPYQLDMSRSQAKRRIACCGRQIGKTWWVAIEAIHYAATRPHSKVLVVSAGEVAALRIIEICSLLIARSPLSGSVVSDQKSKIIFSTGGQIESVPASEKQIRSASIDLLIIDEAGQVPNSIWYAAEGTTTARPDARFVITSTPWGGRDHWFRLLWQKGMDAPDGVTRSWHLPSSVSPFVTEADLERKRSEMPAYAFAQEYLAEWVEEVGAFFTIDELDEAKACYQMVDPMTVAGDYGVVGGLDWGMAHDANAVVYLAALGDVDINAERHGHEPVFWIPAIEQHFRMEYATFVDRLVEHAKHLRVQRFISETNGVGAMPTQVLTDRMRKLPGAQMVNAVTTTAARKNAGFSRIKVLLQQGRLVLPNHPDLLRQLNALTYEQTESGTLKISVPENIGHDDLAMALMQAATTIQTNSTHFAQAWPSALGGSGEILTTARGTHIPRRPSTSPNEAIFWGGKGTKV